MSMLVVDLRNINNPRDIEIIGSTEKSIYYYTEQLKDQRLYLKIFEYNIAENVEHLVITYKIDNPRFVVHLSLLEDYIFLISEDNKSNVWVSKIDIHSGKELSCGKVKCRGNYLGYKVLSSEALLISTETKDIASELSNEKSFKLFYLYKTEDCSTVSINNELFHGCDIRNIYPFKDNEGYSLIFSKSSFNTGLCDTVERVSVDSLLDDSFNTESILDNKGANSLRIVGEDNENIYILFSDHSDSEETIYSHNKLKNETSLALKLNPISNNFSKYHLTQNQFKINRISLTPVNTTISGIYNCYISANFSPKYGEFIDCIENRFIICQNTLNEGSEIIDEYITIYDYILKTEEYFKAKCFISGNNLFLY